MSEFSDILEGLGSFGSAVGNIAIGATANQTNQDNYTANKNWAFADSRAANAMLNYYLKNGSLDGFQTGLNQDYDDVANYLNPYLALNSQEMSERAQDFAEESWLKSFEFSKEQADLQKDLAYNGVSIRAKDYENAGFSPLLAVPGGASASSVSASMGSMPAPSSSYSANRNIGNNNTASAYRVADLGQSLAQLDVLQAQADNIKADTALKNAQTGTELVRPDLVVAETGKTKETQQEINANARLIEQKIKTEGYNTLLTQNQIEKFAVDIATIQHNLDTAVSTGTKTTDQIPFLFSEIQNVVSSLGVDENTDAYKFLTVLGFIGVMMSGSPIKFGSKPKTKKTQTYENRDGKITERVTKESYE